MPRSIAVSTIGRSAREPARCPSATGTPWAVAQRPLPSITIATARGTSAGTPSATKGLDLHDFGFFVLQKLVDLLRVLVGQLLDALLSAALVVGADLALVDELLQMLHRVAADLPDGDAVLLRQPAHDLDEVLAP